MEDNIWTLDGDGELRLSLMATLAQEESRKVSERVKAGQHVSREKGTLYGSGNILGYDRVGDTYVLNPEQAETVRMIYDMYLYEGMGTGKIATRLTELGRLNASGVNKWAHGVVSRVLNNQTYMGVMAYGKSFSNNYLEQRRVNNFDRSTYMYVQGNFPAIVTEEEWHRVQEIKAQRIKNSFSPNAKVPRHGTKENRDLWGSRLECSCGCTFKKNVWHKYVDAPTTYGYQCYNILNNGSGKHRRDAGADDTGYCDQPMIADWKYVSEQLAESRGGYWCLSESIVGWSNYRFPPGATSKRGGRNRTFDFQRGRSGKCFLQSNHFQCKKAVYMQYDPLRAVLGG